MSRLLDSDTTIEILRANPKVMAEYSLLPDEAVVAVSSIVAAELYYGAAKSNDPTGSTQQVAEFLAGIEVLPVNESVAQRFGTLKAHLRSTGQIIPDFDLLIASTALVYGYSVVTHNTRHFVRIPGLVVVDWLV
jgi:tRNA(fMet)-specific endonuclease VapC